MHSLARRKLYYEAINRIRISCRKTDKKLPHLPGPEAGALLEAIERPKGVLKSVLDRIFGEPPVAAIDKTGLAVNHEDRFTAAVAFYPGCTASGDFFAPALILIGFLTAIFVE